MRPSLNTSSAAAGLRHPLRPSETDPWGPLVERVLRVPPGARSFDVPGTKARLHYGLDDETLDRLVDAGLPHEDSGTERLFCESDLHYLALRLGAAGPSLMLSRLQAQTLERIATSAGLEFRLDFIARGDRARSRRDRPPLAVAPPPADTMRVATGGSAAAIMSLVTRRFRAWPPVPAAAASVVAELGQFDWYKLPLELARDGEFARASGLYTCLTAADRVFEALWGAGHAVRRSYGLLLGVPYSTPHAWVEIETAPGDWVPIDPFLIQALTRFGALAAQDWPLTRSTGHIVLRVAERMARLVDHGSGPDDVAYVTAFRPVGASS